MSQPVFTVVAGANGCGKSTLTQWSRADFQQGAILDPDAVAIVLRVLLSLPTSGLQSRSIPYAYQNRALCSGAVFSCCYSNQ